MATRPPATTSVISLTRALRQCRLEQRQLRLYATTTEDINPSDNAFVVMPFAPSSQPVFNLPKGKYRPSQAARQNRFEENHLRRIREFPRLRSTIKKCQDPLKVITEDQLKVLDPTGARAFLFSPENKDKVNPGDILQVRLKSGEPFSGVCIRIRQVHSKIDWAILLRNNLTRVAVEMWFKVFSPNIEAIEVVQRKAKPARRAVLTYMRKPKHDIGSVENIVRQYNMAKAGIVYQKKTGKNKKKR